MPHRADRLAQLMRGAGSVVVLTGAGISVPSGIPDFRSPGTGLWANVDPTTVAHIDAWRADPVRFWSFYGQRFQTLEGLVPNGAHDVVARWARDGVVDAVVTQNIDGLHEQAGTPDVIPVHGTIEHSTCLVDGLTYPLAEVKARIARDPDGVPRCDCSRPLKPGVVLFGELLPAGAMASAQASAAGADLLVCIGSSLEVFPVAELPRITHRNGGDVALVTQGPTPWDGRAAVKLAGDVVAELEAVDAALGGPA